MVLVKDGQMISLDNDNHINAFLGSGWTEAKASATTPKADKAEEPNADKAEEPKAEDVKVTEKKSGAKKKQEK